METDYMIGYNDGYNNAIIDLSPKWIDVSKRTPEYGKNVIVWCGIYGRYISKYVDTENGGQWKFYDGTFGGLPPLKWAEILLPEAPTE
ncbi:hypothetical protein [Pedobacter africanus]|uniref:DUF551 domain-containing protein n=1 Tax=Pedobacter africanus TaxID=151894 RepID=A0A1W1ZCH0_9SPHI|nr:hypothetical protein [Pedobacter africanus]SMC45972.1 hypothetical protein SAMN04488524_0585 [Pedobacter africanus]